MTTSSHAATPERPGPAAPSPDPAARERRRQLSFDGWLTGRMRSRARQRRRALLAAPAGVPQVR